MPKRATKRVVVEGANHGLDGYTNDGCRCKICTTANRDQQRKYRARRYAGNPLCAVRDCPRNASRAAGNGLCYKHAAQLKELRAEKEAA